MKTDRTLSWTSICTALAITCILFLIIDLATGHSQMSTGEVVDKEFRESYFDSKNNYHPPKWRLVLQTENGSIVIAKCEAPRYYAIPLGKIVSFSTYFGGITGIPWSKNVR